VATRNAGYYSINGWADAALGLLVKSSCRTPGWQLERTRYPTRSVRIDCCSESRVCFAATVAEAGADPLASLQVLGLSVRTQVGALGAAGESVAGPAEMLDRKVQGKTIGHAAYVTHRECGDLVTVGGIDRTIADVSRMMD
jgi:hypothetical protein